MLEGIISQDWYGVTARRLAFVGTLAIICAGLGAGVAVVGPRLLLYFGAAIVGCLALFAGLRNWRWSLYGLLYFLPFTGIPTILLYPNAGPAALMKDFLFVIPAYLGFFTGRLFRRELPSIPNAPTPLLWLLAGLVASQLLNPSGLGLLAGLIGLKVWLLYIPMYILGYYLIASKDDLVRFLRRVCLIGVLPAGVGIAEAFLVYTGRSETVYHFYGESAAAATQRFATTHYLGGGVLLRIPSTFSFEAQYNLFTATMVALGYAWLRTRRGSGALRTGILIMFVFAALLSGSRGTFLTSAALLVLVILLDDQRRFLLWGSGGFLLALAGASTLMGVSMGSLYQIGWNLATSYLRDTFVAGVTDALARAPLGMGTGIDTGAARYAFSSPNVFTGLSESWYAKIIFELGVPGLIVVGALVTNLVISALRQHWRLRDPDLRAVSAAMLGLLIWILLYGTKAVPYDIDPTNVYFWLFWGILARLPELEGARASPGERHTLQTIGTSHRTAQGLT